MRWGNAARSAEGKDAMSSVCSGSKTRTGERPGRILPLKPDFAAALTFLLAVTLLPTLTQAAHETPPEREAWYLVKQRCYLCHFIDNQDIRWGTKWGPSLKDLFQRPTLTNGKPVNDQTVIEWITEGSANMPAFRYTLNPRQIQLILTYLKGGFPKSPRQDGTYSQPQGK